MTGVPEEETPLRWVRGTVTDRPEAAVFGQKVTNSCLKSALAEEETSVSVLLLELPRPVLCTHVLAMPCSLRG